MLKMFSMEQIMIFLYSLLGITVIVLFLTIFVSIKEKINKRKEKKQDSEWKKEGGYIVPRKKSYND